MQEELKDTIQNLLDIKLPNNYENLHDLNFLLKLEEIGNIAKGHVERAKHDTVNNQLKTLDEVLEYIPSDQLNDYTICPGYYYLFLDNIKRKPFYSTMKVEDFHHFKNFVDNYNNPNVITIYVCDIHIGYKYLTQFNYFLFYHENDNDFLTKLKTVNKYCDKFLVDTKNKEIHTNFESNKNTITSNFNNFQFLCNYQQIHFKNNGLIIKDNKLINKNNFVTNNNNQKYIELNITHVFDIETNQYLHTKVDAPNNFIGYDMNYYKFITRAMINIKEESEESQILNKLRDDYKKSIVNE